MPKMSCALITEGTSRCDAASVWGHAANLSSNGHRLPRLNDELLVHDHGHTARRNPLPTKLHIPHPTDLRRRLHRRDQCFLRLAGQAVAQNSRQKLLRHVPCLLQACHMSPDAKPKPAGNPLPGKAIYTGQDLLP